MNRRNFIKITGLGIGAAALSTSLVGCSGSEPKENYGWSGPSADEKDIRLLALGYAILCPNPHNKQPWKIDLTGPTSLDLYVDADRLLPETDPIYRQIHIGQGTFLETLAIAATGLGHEAKITYFPQGMYSNTELVNKPVASIELIKRPEITPDPLFAQLLTRHSNKREYNSQGLSQAEREQLQHFHGKESEYPLTIVHSAEAKQTLESVLTQAMEIEVGDRGRDMETIKMFRFNEDEVKKYRDGFGVTQAGLSGITKFVAETFFLSRESTEKDPTSFGEQAVEMTQKAAASTATFAWITTAENSRLDQVKVGRDYCRINLKTTAMGLAQHPMSQVLQEYNDMLPLQTSFKKRMGVREGDTVQMLFRLGRAEATAHGPRRPITELIQS